MSPELAGGFPTTEPPAKPNMHFLVIMCDVYNKTSSILCYQESHDILLILTFQIILKNSMGIFN